MHPSRSQLKLARHRRIEGWQRARQAELEETVPITIRCSVDGCAWSTMTDVRAGHIAYVEHKATVHLID